MVKIPLSGREVDLASLTDIKEAGHYIAEAVKAIRKRIGVVQRASDDSDLRTWALAGTAATQIVPKRPMRAHVVVSNWGGAVVWIGPDASVIPGSQQAVQIPSGVFRTFHDTGAKYAVTAGGAAATVDVVDTYDYLADTSRSDDPRY